MEPTMKICLVSVALIAMFASAGCAASSADENSDPSATQDLNGSERTGGGSERPRGEKELRPEVRCGTGLGQKELGCVAIGERARTEKAAVEHPSEHPLVGKEVESEQQIEQVDLQVRE
jgi:hypothetical protein